MSEMEIDAIDQPKTDEQEQVIEPMNPDDFTDRLDHMVPDQPF